MNSSEKLKTFLRLGTASSLMLAIGAISAPLAVAQDSDTDEDMSEVEEVVVTGSRIRRSKVSSSAPVDVIRTDKAQLEGIVDVGALLRTSTVASGSQQVTAATSAEFVQSGGLGAQTISLRGLGANRTLVLLNGRRAGPAGVRGEVSSFDLNVIPISAIERVEVLKDGASSVYGSDAVAGVINLITKKEDGGSIEAFYSQPQRSGGEELRINATYGQVFDRGNFRITADYYRQSELARGDRSYFQCGEGNFYDPDTGERADAIDPRTGDYACQDLLWGHVWVYDYAADPNLESARTTLIQYDRNGDLGNYIPGIAPGNFGAPDGWYQVNYDKLSAGVADYDHPYQNEIALIPKVETFTGLMEGEYEITDSITAYAEVLVNRRKTYANGYRQYWSYIYNSNNLIFDAGDVGEGNANPLADGWTGENWLSPTPITDWFDSAVDIDYMRVVTGVKGDFGDMLPGWDWDVSAQFSRSDADYYNQQILNDSIDMTMFRTSLCGADEVTPISGKQCVDVDWLDPDFLAGDVSDAEREFMFDEETGTTLYKQMTIDASMTGSLFELPAGSVGAAFGFQFQDESLNDTPGDITYAGYSFNGGETIRYLGNNPSDVAELQRLQGLAASDPTNNSLDLVSNAWSVSSAGPTFGSQKTWAIFGELEVPLIADKPFIQDLSLNISGRYTSVKASQGDVSFASDTDKTYKIGLNWQVTPEIRFRATKSTSFRAPALYESFLAGQTASLRQSAADPCLNWGQAINEGAISQQIADNCAAAGIPDDLSSAISATIITQGGGEALEPETASSKTLGMVWTPDWADLTLTVDYFDITVKGQIAQVGAQNISKLCFEAENMATEPLCDLITRSDGTTGLPEYQIISIEDNYINIATQESRGMDVHLTYRTDTKLGYFTLDTQHTFQFHDVTEVLPGSFIDENGEAGEPKYTGRVDLTLERDKWDFFYGVTFIGATSNVESWGGTTSTYFGETIEVPLEIPFWHYHNASVTYKVNEDVSVLLGVSNLWDRKPPRVWNNNSEMYNVGDSAFYSQYDWYGRRFFLNVKYGF
ncbi:TonB-dependent receptor domain-containing protein [Kordiimonas pumila]|uniref:TonB-dependent receptor domain-containing protein n=1 Tax=Kordiimonas pumila TaxID=2161677 RepID=A0ABV7D7E9_9PROT|nr:TonB-dependent receptor [Kordiimonas pumila]